MFHMQVVGSEAFMSMPHTAQLLYFHFGMRADEDGFVDNALPTVRALGLKPKDLQALLDRRFLLQVGGVLVIKHWKLANTIKNDRMRQLRYPEAAKALYIRSNGIYTDHPVEDGQSLVDYKRECLARKTAARSRRRGESGKDASGVQMESGTEPPGIHLDSNWIPSIAEHSIAEHSTAQQSITQHSSAAAAAEPAAATAAGEMRLLQGELGKGVVLLTDAQIENLLNRMGLEAFDQYVDKLANFIVKKQARVKNHYATILQWWQEDRKVV
ncbi:MAG: hypothetical protein PUK81_03400 [Firmicutes bacterium]|nr:hypothetical protein [Bacillota bacterium]